jgi:RNA polymerase sigma factor for flagellar operon FliA
MAVMTKADRERESAAIHALWAEYRDTGSQTVRNRLVLTLSPLVKQIVGKRTRNLPRHCEVDDFLSCGLEALIRAIDRYDDGHGVTLEQFVWSRIHGAVLDESRRLDWAPRSLRAFQRDRDRFVREFTAGHGRAPSAVQLADALVLQLPEVRVLEDKLLAADIHSLNMPMGASEDEDDGTELLDTLPSVERRYQPEDAIVHDIADDRILRALNELSPRDREIAELLYVEDRTMREVGDLLGVTESRVSQLNSRIKRRVRAALEAEPALAA